MSDKHRITAGLSNQKARHLLELHGPNKIRVEKQVSAFKVLAGQFKNVLILILLAATTVAAILGHTVEAISITVIVLFSVMLGFFQEYRAERAINALKKLTAPTATVIRDGEEQEIPAENVVPGDVLLLESGDVIPADAHLVHAINIHVQESSLTGESVAVAKKASEQNLNDRPLAERTNMVFAGTTVTSGKGQAIVTSTGMQTEIGKIASMLSEVKEPPTPLQIVLNSMGRRLAVAALIVVAVIVAIGFARGQEFVEVFLFGIALAVAVVPEALPAVVTISLALGIQRLAKRKALMRRLSAVETLGSTSVICTDKTGTLTRDEMTVRVVAVNNHIYEVTGAGYAFEGGFLLKTGAAEPTDAVKSSIEPSGAIKFLLTSAVLANDASIAHGTVKGDPTEAALLVAGVKAGLYKSELDIEHPRVDEIPFSSELRRMTTVNGTDDKLVAHCKGAPESIIDLCTHEVFNDAILPITQIRKTEILNLAMQLASDALRVLAIAYKPVASINDIEDGFTFIGLIGMIDPPRAEASVALRTCESAGIRVIMATGDHPTTALAIARELGVFAHQRVITGNEIDLLSDAELQSTLKDVDVFARVAPVHKLRIVEQLQQMGESVAMTGDGVNDAPALRKADIGVAMGIKGTDVAKETSAMILTDDNFASIVAAVEEGRGIFSNIKKYLMFLLSSNIGEIGLVAGAAFAGLPLPLTTVQLLYINLATDGLPALSLAVDPEEPGLMKLRPRRARSGIFTRRVVGLMLIGGIWSTLINLGLFIWALHTDRSYSEAITMTFVSLILIQFFKAYSFRSDRISTFRKPFANHWLNAAITWELMLLAFVVYLPFLHKPFGTYALSAEDWMIVIVSAFTVVPVLEIAKRVWKNK